MPADYYEQTPEANVRATAAVMNTVRTADLLFDRIGRLLRPLNVSAAGGLVLGLLRDHGAMSPSELGDWMIVTRATVTGLLDSLERRGFVERSANPADRRSLIVELTPAGSVVLQQVRERVHAGERAWMSDFSDAELDAFIATLQRIQDRLTAATDDED
jgi:DNA-binding MarR family transcriptional regulator